jgi:hypothetical protein
MGDVRTALVDVNQSTISHQASTLEKRRDADWRLYTRRMVGRKTYERGREIDLDWIGLDIG